MISTYRFLIWSLIALVGLTVCMPVFAEEPAASTVSKSVSDDCIKQMNGVWLIDALELSKRPYLTMLWNSTLTIKDGSLTLTRVQDAKDDLKGTFELGAKAGEQNTIDFTLAGLDLGENGISIPAGSYKGIYKLENDAA